MIINKVEEYRLVLVTRLAVSAWSSSGEGFAVQC
jgi:hypothetical protein